MDVFEKSEARRAAFEAVMKANAAELLQMLGDPLAGQKPDLTPGPVHIEHKDPTQGPPPDTDLQTAQALHNAVDAAFREEMRRQANRMIIAVDFDGTLCEQAWPEIGPARWSVINAILDAQRQGARIILWTNRAGAALTRAVEWCEARGLHFDAVNENLPEIIEQYGSDSRKITADVYVDDKVLNPGTLEERWENRQAWFETAGRPAENEKEE